MKWVFLFLLIRLSWVSNRNNARFTLAACFHCFFFFAFSFQYQIFILSSNTRYSSSYSYFELNFERMHLFHHALSLVCCFTLILILLFVAIVNAILHNNTKWWWLLLLFVILWIFVMLCWCCVLSVDTIDVSIQWCHLRCLCIPFVLLFVIIIFHLVCFYLVREFYFVFYQIVNLK